MLGFLKNLVTPVKPTDAQIWESEVLVVEHPEDGIVYAQNTEIEFDPNPQDVRIGNARAVTALSGWNPHLIVSHRLDAVVNADPRLRNRGGVTLFGQDEEGHSFTWYYGAAADQLLIDKERCDISYPCLPTLSPQDLAALNAEGVDDGQEEIWLCRPLLIVDDEGEIAYQGEVSIGYNAIHSQLRAAWLRANFVTEDGWRPALHAIQAQRKGLLKKDGEHNWTFRGYDTEGLPFTWLIGIPAEEELIRREDHLIPNEPA